MPPEDTLDTLQPAPPDASAPESDAPAEQQSPPPAPQITVHLDNAAGLRVFVAPAPVTVALAPEVMDALVTQWIETHPPLFVALLDKHIKRMQAANAGIQPVTDPATVTRINKSRRGRQA